MTSYGVAPIRIALSKRGMLDTALWSSRLESIRCEWANSVQSGRALDHF
jgi:hypothetical protein